MSDFPTKEKPQLCRNGCGAKIYLDNFTGKYLPYNLDDTQHDCRKQESKQEPKDHEARIEAVIKKVQSVITDLEDLKNQK